MLTVNFVTKTEATIVFGFYSFFIFFCVRNAKNTCTECIRLFIAIKFKFKCNEEPNCFFPKTDDVQQRIDKL